MPETTYAQLLALAEAETARAQNALARTRPSHAELEAELAGLARTAHAAARNLRLLADLGRTDLNGSAAYGLADALAAAAAATALPSH